MKRNKDLSFASEKITIYNKVEFKNKPNHKNTIFVHPPKTSGTNIVLMASALASLQDDFKEDRLPVDRSKVDYPNLIFDGWLGGFWSLNDDQDKNHELYADVDFLSGHFPFGLHEKANLNDYAYVSILRNPVDREISSLNFGYQRNYFGKDDWEQYLFVDSIDNPQTRLLAGEGYMSGEVDEDVLKIAKENVEKHFAYVGVQEKAGEFFKVTMSMLGGAPIGSARAQITGMKIFETVPENLREKLLDKHSLDQKLYDWAKERWNIWFKNNISDELDVNADDELIVLPSDYAQKRNLKKMSVSEVLEHNQDASKIVNLQQEHVELK